jgi:hypothetical protein
MGYKRPPKNGFFLLLNMYPPGTYCFTDYGLQSIAPVPPPTLDAAAAAATPASTSDAAAASLAPLFHLSPLHPLFQWIFKLPSTHISNPQLLHFIVQRHPLLFASESPQLGTSAAHQQLIRGLISAYAELAHSCAYLQAAAQSEQQHASNNVSDLDLDPRAGDAFAGLPAFPGSPDDSSFLEEVFRLSP